MSADIHDAPMGQAPDQQQLPTPVDVNERDFQRLKVSIHAQMVESMDLSVLDKIDREQLARHIRAIADKICRKEPELLARLDMERLQAELQTEAFGLGPLESLMNDPSVSDILVNGPYQVYIERHGRLELTSVCFADEEHLLRIIRRIVGRVGRRIDEAHPMVDARLPDGSRVNAVIHPLVLNGPTLSIRRFAAESLDFNALVANGTMTRDMADFLAAAVRARVSCLISGGTGAGKTTLLNAMSIAVPETERLVTIEDSAELQLGHAHWIRMETRPGGSDSAATEVSQRDLVRNSLRMRPDRIIVGEVRGAEVWDMLQAMNTGHDGSLTTVHANSARDALRRLELMTALTGLELPVGVVRDHVASALTLLVHVARLAGGVRKVTRIAELSGTADGDYVTRDLFRFHQQGVDAQGNAVGVFEATGTVPQCIEQIEVAGIPLAKNMFEKRG